MSILHRIRNQLLAFNSGRGRSFMFVLSTLFWTAQALDLAFVYASHGFFACLVLLERIDRVEWYVFFPVMTAFITTSCVVIGKTSQYFVEVLPVSRILGYIYTMAFLHAFHLASLAAWCALACLITLQFLLDDTLDRLGIKEPCRVR